MPCKNLRPDKYTLDDLDSELTVMAMILAIPREDFALLRTQLLNGDLKKTTVIQAFVTEDAQRRHDSTIASQSALAVASSSSGPCDFCGASGHSQPQCYSFQKAQKQAKERRATRGKGKAATAQEKPAEPAQEAAANASALSSHSLEPSSPSTPLQLDADFTWNADTGATSHMTPHRHWLRNYKPLRLPVKLADNKVVYSAGVGSVVFRPRVKGAFVRSVEFSRVLHVPDLRSNLLSCLHLARNKGFSITISSDAMAFYQSGTLRFVAPIDPNNAAYLDGEVEPLVEASARIAATLPLDLNLWHRRLAHNNYADVQKLVRDELVTGLTLSSKQQPDPVCEPCLAGKMRANPFPPSSHVSTMPLELVHSDVHGPLPVRTHSGYCYWITFIDDYSRFRVVILLKAKSEAFAAFKRFKAYAENQLGVKIKALQDDKGGEYMSSEFIAFTDSCGTYIISSHG